MHVEHRIFQNDRHRPILTELSPYEVPLRFSLSHIYNLLRSSVPKDVKTRECVFRDTSGNFVPYVYSIRNGEGRQRTLGLIHPFLFEDFARLYTEYSEIMISLCNKGEWSLRKPSQVAATFVVRGGPSSFLSKTEDGEDDQPESEHERSIPVGEVPAELLGDPANPALVPLHASTYFAYERFKLMHRFFESPELLALERTYSKCRQLDVAKCFDNIYTHSISWAMKGKSAAKRDKNCTFTFDAFFDSLMQRSNHGETNGILIGSEAARIFAEIILQEVDARMVAPITDLGFRVDRDYTVRRYVDDYFVFYNDTRVADAVQTSLEVSLRRYKLFLNEKKAVDLPRPFMTNISSAKVELRSSLAKLLRLREKAGADDTSRAEHRAPPTSSHILRTIRQVLVNRAVEYPAVSAYLLKYLHIYAKRGISQIGKGHVDSEDARRWLKSIIEVAFFLFASDSRFRTAIVLGSVIRELYASARLLDPTIKISVRDTILRESISVLKLHRDAGYPHQIEFASLLICLKEVDHYWEIPPSVLVGFGCRETETGELVPDYFSVVATIFFMDERKEYRALRDKLLDASVERILSSDQVHEDTELFCFALDLIACPWCKKPDKKKLAQKLTNELKDDAAKALSGTKALELLAGRTWLFDWRSEVATEEYLRLKELFLSY